MARPTADKQARRRRRRLSGLAIVGGFVGGFVGVLAAVRGRALGKDQQAFEARYGRLVS